VDVRVVPEEPFHRCMVEIGSVVDGGDLAGGAAENFGFPGVPVWISLLLYTAIKI
jgi:hypothetical protein